MTTASTELVPCELPECTDQAFYLFKLKKKIFSYFRLCCLHCHAEYTLVMVRGLLITVTSLVENHKL